MVEVSNKPEKTFIRAFISSIVIALILAVQPAWAKDPNIWSAWLRLQTQKQGKLVITCEYFYKYQITKDGNKYKLFSLSKGFWTLIEPVVVMDSEIRFDLKSGSEAIFESIDYDKHDLLLKMINQVVPIHEGEKWVSLKDATSDMVFLEEVVSHKTIDFAFNRFFYQDHSFVGEVDQSLLHVRHSQGYKRKYWKLYAGNDNSWFDRSSGECSVDFQE